MIILSFVPIVVYFLLEFMRKSPIKEIKANKGSNVLIGSAFIWMILIPSLMHLVTSKADGASVWLWVGIVIGMIGVYVRWSVIGILGRFYSRNVGIQLDHELIQTGWYRLIRHPGYLGTFLTFIGFSVSTGSWLAVAINAAIFFIAYSYRIFLEEKELASEFGEQYEAYKSKTWRLLPFIY